MMLESDIQVWLWA